MVSRTCSSLQIQATARSMPMPNPPCGTLPNRRGYLAGWILDPQHVKPGSQMPPMLLEKGELEPLLAYLESLQ